MFVQQMQIRFRGKLSKVREAARLISYLRKVSPSLSPCLSGQFSQARANLQRPTGAAGRNAKVAGLAAGLREKRECQGCGQVSYKPDGAPTTPEIPEDDEGRSAPEGRGGII